MTIVRSSIFFLKYLHGGISIAIVPIDANTVVVKMIRTRIEYVACVRSVNVIGRSKSKCDTVSIQCSLPAVSA